MVPFYTKNIPWFVCLAGMVLYRVCVTTAVVDTDIRLIYASRFGVYKMALNGSLNEKFGSAPSQTVGLDFDIQSDTLFLTSIRSNKIYKTSLDGKGPVKMIVDYVKHASGIAVDWIGRKIYWTDEKVNLIEVAELDGSNRKVLYSEGLDDPRAIAVHPFTKYVYWTNWGYNARIERGSMDGAASSRQVLVNTNIGWVNGLTIDYNIDRVFWVDAKVDRIESMALDGSDRRLVTSIPSQHPFAVTVFGDFLYYTDWVAPSIRKVNKFTGKKHDITKKKLFGPMDIKILYHTRQRNGTNPCATENGGCSHLCLLSAVTKTYSCKCPTGMNMSFDGKTCTGKPFTGQPTAFPTTLHTTQTTTAKSTTKSNNIGGKVIKESPTELTKPEDIRLIYASRFGVYKMALNGSLNEKFGSAPSQTVGLDFDIQSDTLFLTSIRSNKIYKTSLDGKGPVKMIVDYVKHASGIAVDWIGRKIYWTDEKVNLIEVAELDGSNRKVLYSEGLDDPRAIAVHPFTKYVYWTNWGYNPRIERGSMDGAASSRQVLVNTNIGWVNGLTIDYNIDRVFWVDAKVDRIESMALDGSDRKLVTSIPSQHPFAVTVFGDFLYYTDWVAPSIRKVNKFTGKKHEIMKKKLFGPMDIKVLYHTRQRNGTNPCAPNNGGCSHLCLLSAVTKTYSCKCPTGMNMSSDGKTCTGIPFTGQPTAFPTTLHTTQTTTAQSTTKTKNIGGKVIEGFQTERTNSEDGGVDKDSSMLKTFLPITAIVVFSVAFLATFPFIFVR